MNQKLCGIIHEKLIDGTHKVIVYAGPNSSSAVHWDERIALEVALGKLDEKHLTVWLKWYEEYKLEWGGLLGHHVFAKEFGKYGFISPVSLTVWDDNYNLAYKIAYKDWDYANLTEEDVKPEQVRILMAKIKETIEARRFARV